MQLNDLTPADGARHAPKRVGRGIGSGLGKTGGRGHKGQKSRSGGRVKPGFEGGQMPLQRRLPKFGFNSRKARETAEVRLHELARVEGDEVTLESLRAADVINGRIRTVKVINSGEINKAVTVKGLRVSAGAVKAIEAAGGKVEA